MEMKHTTDNTRYFMNWRPQLHALAAAEVLRNRLGPATLLTRGRKLNIGDSSFGPSYPGPL